MTKTRFSLKDAFTMVGVLTLILVAVPLAAFIGVFARLPLLIAVVLAVAIAAIVAAFSPAFREWLNAEVDQEISCNGLRLATGVAISPYHSWARIALDETRVGADDLVQAVLGPIDDVELPPEGRHVEKGEPLFALRHGQRSVAVRSPISGTVLGSNPQLRRDPGLVNEEPFTSGWAVRVQSDSPEESRRQLFRGSGARAWFRLEVDRLLTAFTPGAPALPDGGVFSNELYAQIDDETWRRLNRSFFDPGISGETEEA